MMENEERHASYAAAAGSRSTPHQTSSETVLDSWEDAAQDDQRSEELERSIEHKLGKMKQKQSAVKFVMSGGTTVDHSGTSIVDEMAVSTLRQHAGESRSSADLLSADTPAAAAPIRILKRPQSSGHLPQQGASTHGQSKPSKAAHPSAASSDARYSRNGSIGRQSQHQQQQQRTLEERAAAYAEARMRIFGVADQQIHDDLPVQPKLSITPQSNQGNPESNTNR